MDDGAAQHPRLCPSYLMPILLLMCGAIALSPVILLDPGMPQVSHALVIAAIAVMLTSYFAPVLVDRAVLLIGGFWLFDVFLVNTGNWLATGVNGTRFMLTIAYYGFNFVVLCATASMVATGGQTARNWLRLALAAALAIEIAVVVTGFNVGPAASVNVGSDPSVNARNSGSFDNPNQLGYFGLLVASCWFALHERAPLSWLDGAITAGALFLCISSSSRAAVLGAVALPAIALFRHGISTRAIPLAAVSLVAGTIVAYAMADQLAEGIAQQRVVERFDQSKQHDSFAGRGYDRLWLYPEHLIVGAGEGAYDRFLRSQGGDNEIHSSFATILFGYGILGTALFLGLMWRVCSYQGWHGLALMAPLAVYGLAHQGLRATLLWVLLGILLSARWQRYVPVAGGVLKESDYRQFEDRGRSKQSA
jgi:hypothetical protein